MNQSLAKRRYDLGWAALGLVVLSPVLALLALAVKLSDGGPVLFRQQRVGQGGRLFWICKFRTMIGAAEHQGPGVTRDGDARITRLGRWLRKTKLDELPQLWNVLTGDMSFVGPRPELPRYVARYTAAQQEILQFKPGITDPATLAFRNEEALLATAADVESFYMAHCVPRKIELNRRYQAHANLWRDTQVILRTLGVWAGPPAAGETGPEEVR